MRRGIWILTALSVGVSLAAQSPKPPEFTGATLLMQNGDKRVEVDAALHFGEDAVSVMPNAKKQSNFMRSLKYGDVQSAEYTYGKSPRVAAALLVSPFFLFNASKSHWLTVKTADDYAIVRMDKRNYKLVIAELEKRAHITVTSVGEAK